MMVSQEARDVLFFLDDHIARCGYAPSVREIAAHYGYVPSWAWRRMQELKAAGLVKGGGRSTWRHWTPTHTGIARAFRFGAALAQAFDDIDTMKHIHENRFQD